MDRRDQPAPSHILYTEDDDGYTVEVELPTKWAVCSVCDGEGKHVNPNIDRHGLTYDDFTDIDFASDYMNGVYDVTCYRCHGRTTERVVDWDAMPKEMADAYEEQLKQEAYDRACEEAERRMGA